MKLTAAPTRPAYRFRLFGLPVAIDGPFVFLALLFGAAVGGTLGLVAGAAAATLVVLVHELGHAAAAQAFGLSPSIDLTWWGGLTTAEGIDRLGRARRLAVYVSGSAVGGLAAGLAWWLGGDRTGLAGRVAHLLVLMGGFWGVANLLPILPLDGGLALVDLLPGRPDRRLRTAQVVSVVTGSAAALASAVLTHQIFLGVVVAWFPYLNLVELRSGTRSADAATRLRELLRDLDDASAPEAEAAAREALGGRASAEAATAAGELLVASFLVRRRYHDASAALGEMAHACQARPLRDLAVLGAAADEELERRLAAGSAPYDVRMAAVHRSLTGDHDGAAELATSAQGPALHSYDLQWLQLRAFRAEAWRASILVGDVVAARPDAGWHPAYNVACAWAQLGEQEAALAALDRAFSAGSVDLDLLKIDEDFASLRGLPAFDSLRTRARPRVPGVRASRRRQAAGLAGVAAALAAVVALVAVLPGPQRRGQFEVIGVDLRTGVIRWQKDIGATYAGLAGSSDVVAVSSAGPGGARLNRVVSLRDPADGRELRAVRGSAALAFDASSGAVLVEDVNRDGTAALRAVDVTSGKTRWTVPNFGGLRIVAGVGILSTDDESGIAGVDLGTGARLWWRDGMFAMETAAGAPEAVIAKSSNGHLVVSLDPRTGTERWAAVVNGEPVMVGRHLWVDESAAERTLIDIASGARTTLAVDDVTAEPLVELGERGVLHTAEGIRCVDLPTGAEIWRQKTEQRYFDATVVGTVLVARGARSVVAYDIDSGRVVRERSAAGAELSPVAGMLLLRARSTFEAVNPSDGTVLWALPAGLAIGPVKVFGDTAVVSRRRTVPPRSSAAFRPG